MLIPDGRQVTKVVNDMMKEASEKRTIPSFGDREKLYTKGYIFGHYDSRGGAFFIQAPNLPTAMVMYTRIFRYDENETWESAIAVAEDDYLYPAEMIVLDEAIPEGEGHELDQDYGGIYKIHLLQRRASWSKHWGLHEKILVLHKKSVKPFSEKRHNPHLKNPDYEDLYRFKPIHLGEDAFGLIWIPYDETKLEEK